MHIIHQLGVLKFQKNQIYSQKVSWRTAWRPRRRRRRIVDNLIRIASISKGVNVWGKLDDKEVEQQKTQKSATV
jgi:hypothetical protein